MLTRLSAVVAVLMTAVLTGTAAAAPPPPPNPSDSEISASRAEADAKAARVGELTGRLTQAESRLQELFDDVSYKRELANKARVDLETAISEAEAARREAAAARVEADAASAAVEKSRLELDEFAAASYAQGTTVGSFSAYIGAKSPEDLLARAQMLEAVSASSLNRLDQVTRDQGTAANLDSAARAALTKAETKQAAADEAKKVAEQAQQVAVNAHSAQAAATEELQADRDAVERELAAARGAVNGLEAQRQQYDQWTEAKRREDEENARRAAAAAAAQAAPKPQAPRPIAAAPAPSGNRVQTVINRALAQRGVIYAWGGGNHYGPTYGVRDGGVADSYGDFRKIGFDCSGLMMYAFAGAGVFLPHYSGYQYNSGRKVPLSQMAPGDMIFWGPGGGTHVALYLGGGMMVEAPHSGAVVRISPVRYGGIMPYVTRML
ncbi:NlpC/P60 family protein [Lentzea flaviverrucosa]|uniref:Cell wall-associated hydrolase, NlpC family n=1 Tax=Lentzea flaviverrucosa TaxID=200379 RepID=A0A1H9WGL7_9PSEU|nr:NlpC/P60 family protein [Lentzea flaviverrucosa]RDI22138.1 cell wall-associated NlpC family hydrolase [Lentzea flaviverrucosa]SES32603.1 Cell wall-associated hydrolase, NlpC family [Lentzea flaviverrucosa]